MDRSPTARREQFGLAALYLTIGLVIVGVAGAWSIETVFRVIGLIAGLLLVVGAAYIFHRTRSTPFDDGARAPGI